MKITIDVSEPHSGVRVLAISFEGSPPDAGLYQLIPVEPDTRYRFSMNVKAADLEGINGPRFALNDVSSGYSYVLTDPVLGTTAWTEQTAEFSTGRDTTALIFRVLRSPARMLIRGKTLIDDLGVTPIKTCLCLGFPRTMTVNFSERKRDGTRRDQGIVRQGQESGEKTIGLTMAIVAVLLAFATMLGHRTHTEEVLIQTKANDQWAYYQAKNIRSHMYEANSEMAGLIKKDASVAEDFRKKSEDQKQGAKVIRVKAEDLEREVEITTRRAGRFDASEIG